MFDRTTNDCKLFSGSLDDLRADCKEVGYAKEPAHASCDVVFDSGSENGCYVRIYNIQVLKTLFNSNELGSIKYFCWKLRLMFVQVLIGY